MEKQEILGYVASLFVMASFLFKDIRKLRIMNCIGCGLFVIYSYWLGSIPIALTNGFIILINSYFLFWKKPATT